MRLVLISAAAAALALSACQRDAENDAAMSAEDAATPTADSTVGTEGASTSASDGGAGPGSSSSGTSNSGVAGSSAGRVTERTDAASVSGVTGIDPIPATGTTDDRRDGAKEAAERTNLRPRPAVASPN